MISGQKNRDPEQSKENREASGVLIKTMPTTRPEFAFTAHTVVIFSTLPQIATRRTKMMIVHFLLHTQKREITNAKLCCELIMRYPKM